jgi:S1-C subfamily serine protease
MKNLEALILFIVIAILSGCTLQYPLVGTAKDYNEVFKGTVTANPWTGHGYVDVQAIVSKTRCAGPARVTSVPQTGSVAGQMGSGVLTCEDGRVVSASYTITGWANGFGIGKDQYGNEFTFSFGMSDNDAAQKVSDFLKTAATRPALPSRKPQNNQRDKIAKQESAPRPTETKDGPSPSTSIGSSLVFGTGFFVNGSGVAVTNAHVVESCKNLLASSAEAQASPMSVIALDRENDLAVLKLSSRVGTYAQFRTGPPVRQGEQVIIYGYPLAGALSTQGNLSTGIVSALAGLFNDTRDLQISAPVQVGNSGGPVLDASGNVIGIVTSKLNAIKAARITGDIPQNVNFAIKASIVINFLDANSVKYDTTTGKKDRPTADIGDMAKAFTFAIICEQ